MTSNVHDSERSVPAPVWLLPLAMLALLAGMWAGLLRLGWAWPVLIPTLPMMHGPLMVGGFLGTVIGLERAVGTGKRWAYAAPILTGAGTIALLVAADSVAGPLLITAGSAVLVGALWTIYQQQPALFTATLVMGGMVWLAGNLLWLYGLLIPQVVLWWAGFLILTIAGERLELSRLLRLSGFASGSFALLSLLMLAGMALSVVNLEMGTRIAGAAMLGLALWLLRYDIARRRIKAGGQARFIAICLLTGYIWLGFGGLLAMRFGGMMAGPQYDAMLHAIFLGFVFSMIFGHALIIFPALLTCADGLPALALQPRDPLESHVGPARRRRSDPLLARTYVGRHVECSRAAIVPGQHGHVDPAADVDTSDTSKPTSHHQSHQSECQLALTVRRLDRMAGGV